MTDKYSLHNIENIIRAKIDREYLGELLLHNEDLIWFSIRNYVGDPIKLAQYNGMEKDDIHQIGRMGFINAIDNFDPSKGVLFTTYAPAVISGEVKSYIRDKGKLIRLPRSAHDLNIKIKKHMENTYYDKYIPIEQVAKELGEDTEDVKKAITTGEPPLYASQQKKEQGSKGHKPNAYTAVDLIYQDKNIDVEQEVIDLVYIDQLLDTVRSKLEERDMRILDAKLEGKTHEQIANEEDISKITVTRTMNKIRKILREAEK